MIQIFTYLITNKMSNQSQTIIFTNLFFTNCPIPICDDVLAKLLGRQCAKHGKIVYCNVNGSKNTGIVKFQSITDAIFVKNLYKSIMKINFLDEKDIKTQQRNRIGKMLEELL
jgi:hypothetical protein